MNVERVCFADVVTQKTEAIDPIAEGVERYVAIEHLDPAKVSVERWGKVSEGTTFTRRFGRGDVLFSKRRAYQGKAALASFDGVCSGDLLVFSAKPDRLHPDLLPYLVQSEAFRQHALATSAGSLSPRTKWKDLATFELTLPNWEKQERLAQLLTQTERARMTWALVGEKAQLTRRVAMGAYIEAGRWPVSPLADVAYIQNGTTPSRRRPDYWSDGTIPWLPTGKVHDREIHQADEFITEAALRQCPIQLVPAGSVLVAMIGQGKTRGAAAYLHFASTINQNFAAVIPRRGLAGRYLFHVLDASYSSLRRMSQGSSQGALNCRLIGEFEVPIPSAGEQEEIAGRLDAIGDAVREAHAQEVRILALQRETINDVLMAPYV